MPGTVLGTLHVICHLFLSHFTHGETRAQNCHMTCPQLHSWLITIDRLC